MAAFFSSVFSLWNQILYAISNIRVFDIVDIVVIAFVIYKAIGFLRETRAGQLVKGLAVLIFAYIIANTFELAILRWLLSAVFNSAIVAMAVIFQPELRRVLERVGQVNLGHSQSLEGEDAEILKAIDNICKAAGNMQETKTGALIVFERKTQLGDIINSGTVIDAVPSISMVNNVFFPKSPLHDGAMIVRDGRLYAAGCILPLTQSTAFSSKLGTRHRAAIGMTENSDAIVLVVSEETGIISIAYNGEITRNHSVASAYTEIKDKLLDEYIEERENNLLAAIKRFLPLKKSAEKEENVNED